MLTGGAVGMNAEKRDEKKLTYYTEYPTRLLYLPHGMKRFEKLGIQKNLMKNYVIIEPGQIPAYCFIVKKGRVISYEFTPSGEERVYNFMEEGSLCLEANVLVEKPVPIYFKTAMPSELICIDRAELLSAMASDPQLTFDVLESVSDKFLASMDQIREGYCHNATWKLCNLLFIFADRFGVTYDGKVLIKEKVSQQMLSNLLGINRITTVRIIKELKDLNLIEQINGYYCIRNIEKLKQHQNYFDEF